MKSLLLTAALVLAAPVAHAATPAPAPAATPAPPPLLYGKTVTLEQAKAVIAAAEAESKKNGWTMVITVVEPNGAVVASEKMDGTQYGSSEVAMGKAQTSARFKRPTLYFQEAVKSGTLNSIFTGAMALEGGELLVVDNTIIGAVGVSGAAAFQDGQVARAGAAAVK